MTSRYDTIADLNALITPKHHEFDTMSEAEIQFFKAPPNLGTNWKGALKLQEMRLLLPGERLINVFEKIPADCVHLFIEPPLSGCQQRVVLMFPSNLNSSN